MWIHRGAITVASAMFLVAVPAHRVAATPPDREHETITVSDSIDCSAFGHGWDFTDHFVDEFEIDRQYFYDRDGNLIRVMEHRQQTSTDVNSVTGLTISEHNHFLVDADLVNMTLTISGSMNNAQRRGIGSVIRRAGHKIWELDLTQDPPFGPLLFNGGPLQANDADFCQALA